MEDKALKFGRTSWCVLLLFGMLGQIAWSVENMFFNLFIFDTVSPSLDAITLMVQLSGVTATVVTLIAGTVSDKLGNRRSFISWGYIIWGVSVALFGFISPSLISNMLGMELESAVKVALVLVIVGDCIMTAFGSCANDAAFNAWVTDNTESRYRGTVEGVLSILPLLALLIVAGGFGIIVGLVGYRTMFLILGVIISLSGVFGIFFIKDKSTLARRGSLRDIIYGFRPSVIKENKPFYITLLLILVYGVACQTFMPYIMIYMSESLHFSVIEYSLVFGIAIAAGAGVNLYLTRLSDKLDKTKLLYIATAVMSAGLLGMYFAKGENKTLNLVFFGITGFVMISGYIFISALAGSTVRDYTPEGDVGKLQGVRMVFSVLVPMVLGPMIGNGINSIRKIPISNPDSADSMTTKYIPAPEIFLAAAIIMLVLLAIIPWLRRTVKNTEKK